MEVEYITVPRKTSVVYSIKKGSQNRAEKLWKDPQSC